MVRNNTCKCMLTLCKKNAYGLVYAKKKLKNCFQTNHQAPLASLTEYYKLVTLISKDSF